jgi:hypothetical protein
MLERGDTISMVASLVFPPLCSAAALGVLVFGAPNNVANSFDTTRYAVLNYAKRYAVYLRHHPEIWIDSHKPPKGPQKQNN